MIKELWNKIVNKVKSWFGRGEDEVQQAAEGGAMSADGASSAEEALDPQLEAAIEQMTAPQPREIPESQIGNALHALNGAENQTPGYLATDSYPTQFQVADFPTLAGAGDVTILGNNQAHFFVENPSGNQDPEQMTLNTKGLETLLENVLDNQTRFIMAMDSDVFENPERFVGKYQALRPEPDQPVREALLAKEVELIQNFVAGGGMHDLACELIAKKSAEKNEGQPLPKEAVEMLAAQFLESQFAIVGMETEKPLEAGLWRVDAGDNVLLAKQSYDQGTANTERKWQVGTARELEALAQSADNSPASQGAQDILAAIESVKEMDGRKYELSPQMMQQQEASLER